MLPVFVALVLGVLEGGRVMLANQTMRAATSTASRSASIAANDASADYQILQAIEESTQGRIRSASIDRIIIYKATGSDDPVPDSCLVGPIHGLCNVYDGRSFDLDADDLATCDSSSPARFWCPTDRKYAAQNDNGNGPPDWIGIYIEADFDLATGVFGDQLVIKDSNVTRVEAKSIV